MSVSAAAADPAPTCYLTLLRLDLGVSSMSRHAVVEIANVGSAPYVPHRDVATELVPPPTLVAVDEHRVVPEVPTKAKDLLAVLLD